MKKLEALIDSAAFFLELYFCGIFSAFGGENTIYSRSYKYVK